MFLTVNNISFGYNKSVRVLSDISFALEKGKTLAIVGASGCGKSTLLRIISGLLPNGGNQILEGDIHIENRSPDEYRQKGKLAFMFQEATLMPQLTVSKNIGLPLNINGNTNEELVNSLTRTVGLEEYKNYLPKQLSGGMKTRVALARSFITSPELLLLDEPFSALDIAWKSKLYVELEKLREETETTVVMVTHDVQEALLLADHVLVMNQSGGIEFVKKIKSEFSIMERVSNISQYMNSVYETYMLPIQDAIMNGQNEKNEKQNIVHIA